VTSTPPRPEELDPFDLPEWLGTEQVTWTSASGLRSGHLVTGWLTCTTEGARAVEPNQPCDLLAVDEAYPAPVVDNDTRTRAHQAWRNGQVLVVAHPAGAEARLTLAVPGRDMTAGRVLDAVARLSKAVGASADDWSVLLRIGEERAATRRGR
jgi:type IV pilus biogenesis protein CpaD/CtpE